MKTCKLSFVPARFCARFLKAASSKAALGLLFCVLFGSLAKAATITVANAKGSGPGSLYQAIADANANPDETTIDFDPTLFSKAQTIDWTFTPQPIKAPLIVKGSGASLLTLTANGGVAFELTNNTTATISGLTIKKITGAFQTSVGTTLTVKDCVALDMGQFGVQNKGTATLTNCTVENASLGFDNYGTLTANSCTAAGSRGYGFINEDATAKMTLNKCEAKASATNTSPSIGIKNVGTLDATDCNLIGVNSYGVENKGTATLANCDVSQTKGIGIGNVGNLTMTNCTIKDGSSNGLMNEGTLKATKCVWSNPTPSQFGLGIISRKGSITLTGCTLSNYYIGIHNVDTAKLTDCTLSNSISQGFLNDGTALLTNCVLKNNGTVQNSAQGISNSRALTAFNCSIQDNRQGIYNTGTVIVENCSVIRNPLGGYYGGGQGVQGIFRNSTIAKNGTATSGSSGGINNNGVVLLNYCTVSGNAPFGLLTGYQGTIAKLKNTIIADNETDVTGVAVTSVGYNLIGKVGKITGFNGPNDQVGTDTAPINAKLGPLESNGGPTLTMLPQAGSPAIDKGDASDNFGTLTIDQRGLARPFDDKNIPNAPGGNGNDIGAVEVQPILEPNIVVEFPAGTALRNNNAVIPFGSVKPTKEITKILTLKNTGTAALTLGVVSIGGANKSDFSAAPLAKSSLAPGESTTLSLTFKPAALGTSNATLQIASNDPDENPFGLRLTGIGNTPPVASDQTTNTEENTAKTITLAATDADAGAVLTYGIVQKPKHGMLSAVNGKFVTYTPDKSYLGPDSFEFKANDGTDDSNVATVSLQVNSSNRAPVANDQDVTTDEDTAKAITLVATDSDPGTTLLYYITQLPTNGKLSIGGVNITAPGRVGGNLLTYTPNPDYPLGTMLDGSDSFKFKANDSKLDSNEATVSITVKATSDAPIAKEDNYSTRQDAPLTVAASGVLANDSDPDGDKIIAVIHNNVNNGRLTLNADGGFTYQPNPGFAGTDKFTYHASDGALESAETAVTIAVKGAIPITDFAPKAGAPGAVITVTGQEFTGARLVQVNGQNVAFKFVNDTTLTFTVPNTATSGKITITTGTNSGTSADTFVVAPRIVSFTPDQGAPDSTVQISGANLDSVTDASIGGEKARIDSATEDTLVLIVPTNAPTGPIEITNPGGTATSVGDFTVLPVGFTFTPRSGGAVGALVTLTRGSGVTLDSATDVLLNGLSVGNFNILSPKRITFNVPAGATSGKITVVRGGGLTSLVSATNFEVAPVITDVTPMTGPAGTEVVITGENLKEAIVRIRDKGPTTYLVRTATEIRFVLPNYVTSGAMTVTNGGGSVNVGIFTVTP